jgi:hypothetical protein
VGFKRLLGFCVVATTISACGPGSPPQGMAELELAFAEIPECKEVVDGVCVDFVSEFVFEGPSGEIRFRTGPGGEWSQVLEPGTYTFRASGSDGCPSPGEFELHEGVTHERSVVWPMRC